MDADASTPLREVKSLMRYVGKYEVVIGSRYLKQNSIKVHQPLTRRVISRLGNAMIQAASLPGIRDSQCGFKIFSARAANGIFPLQQVSGWLFDVEILTIARELGYVIKEVPVDWYDARESKLRAIRTAWRSVRDLTGIRRRVRAGQYRPAGTLKKP